MPAKPKELKWKKIANNRTCIVSECGRFYVGKLTVDGKDFFEVSLKEEGKMAVLLRTRLTTADEAKNLAASHAANMQLEIERAINHHPLKQSAHARLAEGPK